MDFQISSLQFRHMEDVLGASAGRLLKSCFCVGPIVKGFECQIRNIISLRVFTNGLHVSELQLRNDRSLSAANVECY